MQMFFFFLLFYHKTSYTRSIAERYIEEQEMHRRTKEAHMLLILIGLLLLIALDIAAMRWGYDSRDGLDSREWERRNQYQTYRWLGSSLV